MSVIGSNILAGASGQGGAYNLTNSLRFRSSASAYLNRTPSSSPTDAKKFTYSTWIKKAKNATSNQFIYGCGSSGSDETYFGFNSSDAFEYLEYTSSAYQINVSTTAVFRDPSAWYHLVLVLDSTQATSTNRVKLYINGVQQTLSGTFPSLNYATSNVNSTDAQNINRLPTSGGLNFDGYYAEVNMVDGQALTPSSFGETSTTTGVWIPKKYTGTYGTNGFYLDFEDTSSTAALGYDAAGSNDWTVNNISLTAGTTYDSMTDVPTLTSATTANYCVLNPLNSNGTVSGGNLNYSMGNTKTVATMAMTAGKYYSEVTINSVSNRLFVIGIGKVNSSLNLFSSGVGYYADDGTKYVDGANSGYGATYTAGDVLGIAVNFDSSQVTFYKNNTSQGAITFSSSADGYTFVLQAASGSTSATFSANFGQRPFTYTPPTGFVALNTFNLPTPTIGATASTTANKYFNATTYTGDGTNSKVITTGGGADFVWIKRRDSATSHILFDAVRGAGKTLYSHLTNAEVDNGGYYVQSFGNTGFTLGTGGDAADNANGGSYVAWSWDANGTGSTNTAGSITSTVSANTSAGFSIVTFTGNSTAGATIGHGLGVAPTMAFVKSRSSAYNWCVYAKAANSGNGQNGGFYLNLTDAWFSDSGFWNNTTASSTVLTLGSGFAVNNSGSTYVAYCFAPVAGYSAFGSYTGNGSTDGSFVFTGFRPRFVIVKRTNDIGSWIMSDSARSTYNVTGDLFNVNTSGAEFTTSDIKFDYLSNGFKLREVNGAVNASGSTYIYMAFCESPFKFSNAR